MTFPGPFSGASSATRTGRVSRFLRCLGLFALALWADQAAACTFSETGGTVGTVSSFRVRSGPAVTSSATFQFNCAGVVIAVAAGQPAVRATLVSAVTGLTLKNAAGDAIGYQITGTASAPYVAGQVVINVGGSTALALLTGGQTQVPFNITTTVGANIPAGTYTDTLQVMWSYSNICEGLANVGGLCVGLLSTSPGTTRSLLITLTVTNDCAITAPNVQFGSAPLLSGFSPVAQQVSLLCTKDLTYTVGMGPGSSPSGGRRRMASGTNRLAYDIFKADNTVWGATGAARADGPAKADGLNLQVIPYTARIYQDQVQPALGTYLDTVTVDVGF